MAPISIDFHSEEMEFVLFTLNTSLAFNTRKSIRLVGEDANRDEEDEGVVLGVLLEFCCELGEMLESEKSE